MSGASRSYLLAGLGLVAIALIASSGMAKNPKNPVPITAGGTGANNAGDARTNLEAAKSGANNDITSLSGLTTPLSVAQGGTGAGNAAGARLNLGVVEGFTDGILMNMALGLDALGSNTTGQFNTALGDSALADNDEGSFNTAVGAKALAENIAGVDPNDGAFNTAVGAQALMNNTTASFSTAVGADALAGNVDGGFNTAVGVASQDQIVDGSFNVSVGVDSLGSSVTGGFNAAIGTNSLSQSTGSRNIALGTDAGSLLQTGDSNIYIGNRGDASESNTMRLGSDLPSLPGSGQITRTFIAGIDGVDVGAAATGVFINSDGQLGTVASSQRFKEDIRDMGRASSGLMQLRPVTFRYKKEHTEGARPTQYGLIAEEVAKIYPDLVVYSKNGEARAVQYHKVNAMLLNEVQKQHQRIRRLEEIIAGMTVQRKTAESERIAAMK